MANNKVYKTTQAKKLDLIARNIDAKLVNLDFEKINEVDYKKIKKFFEMIEQLNQVFNKHIKNI